MIDRVLVFEDFADRVGDGFTISIPEIAEIELSLVEAQPLPNRRGPEHRQPFSLIFRAADPRVLPQQIHLMKHEALGEMAIFLVPVGKSEAGVEYQATFN